MTICEQKKFCGCCDLTTGILILGILYIPVAIAGVLFCLYWNSK